MLFDIVMVGVMLAIAAPLAVFAASVTAPVALETESCIPLSWSCIPDAPVWSNAPFTASPA